MAVVAVGIDFDAVLAPDVLRGVEHYARRRAPSWTVIPVAHAIDAAAAELCATRQIQGMMGAFAGARRLRATIGRSRMPTVNLRLLASIPGVSEAGFDESAIGALAAAELMDALPSARTFVFAGWSGAAPIQERAAAFANALKVAGRSVDIAPNLPQRLWPRWLAEVPFPAAVFCADDAMARLAAEAARLAGRRVPEDIAIAGTGNDPSQALAAGIALTSIELPAFELGTEAARLLHARMEGSPAAKPARILLAPGPIHRRASSRRASPTDRNLAPATDLIASHWAEPLSVTELARRCGLSRRAFEIRFRKHTGQSPKQAILNNRLTAARRLLRESDLPIAEIGRQCGFPRAHHFAAAFKTLTGLPPRAYRQAATRRGNGHSAQSLRSGRQKSS